MSTVYLETSFISYLAAQPSSDDLIRTRQEMAHLWWRLEQTKYKLFVSELVIAELARGDEHAAARRLRYVNGLETVFPTPAMDDFSGILFKDSGLPSNAKADAAHVAFAVLANADYLVTLNMAHINNPFFKIRMRRVCAEYGYSLPEICTPEELLGDRVNER